MSGDQNLMNHPNWNAILQWSLRYQDEHRQNEVLKPIDKEVGASLSYVMNYPPPPSYHDYQTPPVTMTTPPTAAGVPQQRDRREDSSREECVEALEELAYSAEDMDEANGKLSSGGELGSHGNWAELGCHGNWGWGISFGNEVTPLLRALQK
eukprot:sb/3473435/